MLQEPSVMTVGPERCKALALLALEVSTEEGRVGRAREDLRYVSRP